jgi:SPP1 gp7 family putative phage head morphogenesis protein
MNSAELLQLQLSAKRTKPKATKPDLSNGVTYAVELKKLVRAISADIDAYIIPTVRSLAPEYARDSAIEVNDTWVDILTAAMKYVRNKWSSPQFQLLADTVARRFIQTANQSNRSRNEKSMGINIYADSQVLNDYVQASVVDNTRLITSIPEQYLTQVESIVLTNVRAGGRPSAIAKSLQQQFGITERRAKMIARDQTAKVNGDLNRMRQMSAGFPYFEWMDSDDERVRDRHRYLTDHVTAYGRGIYRWDNPPLSDKGVPIIPGIDYQCRCVARPVSQEEVDANIKAGRVAPGVLR